MIPLVKKGESKFLLSSSDVSIYNGVFKLTDENKENPKKLHFNDLNINATNFLINGSDVSARINTLSLVDSRGLALENLMTNFEYSPSRMSFAKLQNKNSKICFEWRFAVYVRSKGFTIF